MGRPAERSEASPPLRGDPDHATRLKNDADGLEFARALFVDAHSVLSRSGLQGPDDVRRHRARSVSGSCAYRGGRTRRSRRRAGGAGRAAGA